MTQVSTVEHISPCALRVNLEADVLFTTVALQVNTGTLSTAMVEVADTSGIIPVLDVRMPSAQDQLESGVESGGAPEWFYILLSREPVGHVAFVTVNMGNPMRDWWGNLIMGDLGPGDIAWRVAFINDANPMGYEPLPYFWEADGLRTRETLQELRRLGRLRLTSNQPLAWATAHMIGKINDLVSGGFLGSLGADIAGPSEPTDLPEFGGGGFSEEEVPTPGIGDFIYFADGLIPSHIDKLWGVADGENDLFRTSALYHAFACTVIQAGNEATGTLPRILESSEWFAPDSGNSRLLRMVTPPDAETTLLAIYTPRQSIIQIGEEILAYHESSLQGRFAVICGRSQLCSPLQAHSAGDTIQDVWCASMVDRIHYATLAFGASGRALEYIGLDSGAPREDNARLNDTELRRSIFHTSVTMRATPQTVQLALRYMFPELYPYINAGEDPRWPGCLTIWYSANQIRPPRQPDPPVEPWETWLDDIAWPDGFPLALYAETYYRDDAVDAEPYGDYFVDSPASAGVEWPFPVVLCGPEIGVLGEPSTSIPPPYYDIPAGVIRTEYLRLLQRPKSLDKVLPAGCGVLILDYGAL